MKKFVSMLLALVMVFALCACGSKTEDGDKAESIKVGFICLHDENSTYDKNFIDAAKAACKNAGLSEDQYIIKTNIPEGQECYNAAAELVDAGCNVVFADSFGHEDFMIQAAKDFPKVQFCHATGTKAHTSSRRTRPRWATSAPLPMRKSSPATPLSIWAPSPCARP